MLFCPECTTSRPLFSSRCPQCTASTGILFFWLVNLVAWIIFWALVYALVQWLID